MPGIENLETMIPGEEQINGKHLNTLTQKHQIFLLHFAGGSCYSFDFLRKYIPPDLEFRPLEIPGRGKRFQEKLLKTKQAAIQDYLVQIKKLRNKQPYLIYGHSMGASLALNIVKHLEDLGDPPCHLIVSGNSGPGIKEVEAQERKRQRHLMNDEDLKEDLRTLGGMPEEILENEELYNFFSPILRADFELLESDDVEEENIILNTPIYALMGSEENYNNKIINWRRFTSNQFQYKILKGNHFFISKHPEHIANIIKTSMNKLIS